MNAKRRKVATALPRDVRMMHARTRLAWKVRTIPLLPLFTLSASLKISKVLGQLPWTLWNTIGWRKCPSASENIHRLLMKISAQEGLPIGTEHYRSAESSCRIWFLTATRTDSVWHGISSKCMHGYSPNHVTDSREYGPWPSGYQ